MAKANSKKGSKSKPGRGQYDRDKAMSPELRDRRKHCFALRSQGRTFKEIAEIVGIDINAAYRDVRWANDNWGDSHENGREAIRGQLLEVLREATSVLIQDIHNQQVNGQQVVATDGQGRVVGVQTKRTVDPRSVAEVGRTVERIGKLTGLLESGIDAGNGGAAAIQVVLPGAMDGNAFTAAAASGELTAGVVDTQALPEAPSEGS